jgi:hypothetical protein
MLQAQAPSVKSGFAKSGYACGMAGFATRLLARRAIPITWLLIAGQVALATRRHLQKLEPHERRRLAQIVRSSRGRPSNVSKRERDELLRLVRKLDLARLGRDVAGMAAGGRRRGRR